MDTDETIFTDAQVTDACDLHPDNLRRLITWNAVRPAQSGGGRGRVRLWTLDQAMRIAMTAEFFKAGFSLQQAHTLTYCVRYDNMLALYDLKRHDKNSDEVKELFDPSMENPKPNKNSHQYDIIILNHKYVYSSDYDLSSPALAAVLDLDTNTIIPTMRTFISDGDDILVIRLEEMEVYSLPIHRKSLLFNDEYVSRYSENLEEKLKIVKNKAPSYIVDSNVDPFNYRTYLKIDLRIGLHIAFRRLMNIPVNYELEK